MSLRFTAALGTAFTSQGRIISLYFGDLVPEGISKESLAHLKSLGFVADDEAPVLTIIEQDGADVAPPVVGGDVPKPAGNAGLEEWTAYARSQGATDADLDGLSRNDVRDLYK
jgi:hypothetical protein